MAPGYTTLKKILNKEAYERFKERYSHQLYT